MPNDFKWRHFQGEVSLWAVRWYCKYGISYRELEEMLQERGITVDNTTIYRWVQYYAPELQKRLKWFLKGGSYHTWHLDETYVRVKGEWKYLYRAVDARGNTLDFYLSHTRDAKAAKLFLGMLLKGRTGWNLPGVINTDKAPIYGLAIQALKAESKLPESTRHRQVKYLNNRIEADHGRLKHLIKPTSGFKNMQSARATLQGFEAMHALRKGQAKAFQFSPGIQGEVRLIERCFNLGDCAIAEVVNIMNAHCQQEAS